MKRKRFSEEQIAFALRQHESGTPVAEIVRKLGVTEQCLSIDERRNTPVWAPRRCGS